MESVEFLLELFGGFVLPIGIGYLVVIFSNR